MNIERLNDYVSAAMTLGGLIVAGLRMVPPDAWAKIEAEYPRGANLARVLRALAPDVIKAARAAWSVLRGVPWARPVAPIVDKVLGAPEVK